MGQRDGWIRILCDTILYDALCWLFRFRVRPFPPCLPFDRRRGLVVDCTDRRVLRVGRHATTGLTRAYDHRVWGVLTDTLADPFLFGWLSVVLTV